MQPYLSLGGIRQNKTKLELFKHLRVVLEELECMQTNLGLTIGQLNNDKDDIIDKFEEEYNVSFGKAHNKLDEVLQAVYKEIKKLEEE